MYDGQIRKFVHMLLGEILVDSYGITALDIERALKFQEKYGGLIGSILMNMGIISEETLVSVLSKQLDIALLQDIDRSLLDFKENHAIEMLNYPFLIQRNWLPLCDKNDEVLFAVINPPEL